MNVSRVSHTAHAVFALSCAGMLLAGTDLAAQAPARAATGQQWLTRPERTDYAETSRYDEVIAYMKQMAAVSPQIHLTTYGYTYEGRPLPLAVIGAPGVTPEQVIATKKTRVYIQANIHAGEVEGKEAVLWLLRSIARGERNEWLKTTVLLINPIYNADGNERVNVTNRGSQAGPVGGMGQRENAQGFDLNRDGTKLETAEARSMASLLTRYQPHVAMDLHTTDGSSNSGFNMTYETSLNPNNSKGTMSLLRDVLLPEITKTIKAKHGSDWFYYGGVSGTGAERAWRSDAELAKPRYTSTYYGVRNILGLLTETYSYASFKTRITETYWFLEEVLGYVATHGEKMRDVVAMANKESIIGQQLAVRQVLVKAPALQNIVFAPTVSTRNPYVADRPYRLRTNGPVTSEMLPFFGTTEPTETSLAPRVWVVPMSSAAPGGAPPATPAFGGGRGGGGGGTPTQRMIASVIDRLEAHGIAYTLTTKDIAFSGERFKIASNTQADREYQGTHKARTLTGAWESTEQTLPAGSLVIAMDQPLARLAFILFDPRSDDGFMWWNILDPVLGMTPAPAYYPVLRSMTAVGN
ncbi:MAG: succinylglutamate desuccinylase/aspartoacylase family protein [Gemmatimonadaceae bacterium]|nr:succinylglutamate desuccinylase/aspartoacylase family protein [Gemmatimonadaceae bacterium]